MVHHLLARTTQPPPRKVDSANHHREHIVEIVGDAAGQLADRLHLLDLAELGLGRLALDRFRFERLVGFPQFLRAVAHRFLELGRAVGLGLGLAAGGGILAKRLDRDQPRKNCAAADDQPEPAEIIGQPVGFGGDDLALSDPLAQRCALGRGNFVELAIEELLGSGLAGGEIICGSALSLLEHCGARRKRQFLGAFAVNLLQFLDPHALVGIVPDEILQPVDLVSSEAPLAVIDVAGGCLLLVEDEAAERGLGARRAGADVASDQGHIISTSLGG